jgi:exodeoxyribonuclease V alpha subunit
MTGTFSPVLRTAGLADLAKPWIESGVLGQAPLSIVDAVAPRYDEPRAEVVLALALVLEAQNRGHAALDLLRIETALAVSEDGRGEDVAAPPWPDRAALSLWQAAAVGSPLVGDLDQPATPFECLETRAGATLLMSRRMAWDQRALAARLRILAAAAPNAPVDVRPAVLDRLFPGEDDGQGKVAARKVAEGCITVITGGPGTGKTWSIKRVLAALLEQRPDLRILLAAPTGKAAVRMTEAMGEELKDLKTDDAVKARLKELPSSTVHKLLGVRPNSGATRYGPDRALPADVVVVDEASMLDVVLMRKLLAAVGEGTRLVLLGDRDQLASVESGTVLADLVAGYFAGETAGLAGRVVAFSKNHRSKSAPTVAAIAEAVQAATEESLDRAVELLMGRPRPDEETKPDGVSRVDPQPGRGAVPPEFYASLARPYLEGGYVAALAAALKTGPSTALDRAALVQALGRYRVLATHRKGPLGVSGLNRQIGALVRARLQAAWGEQHAGGTLPTRGGLWLGEPVLVTTNAYDVDLRNGDIGLVLPDDTGRLVVWFPVSKAGERGVRAVSIPRLPPHGPALAMTVHKAQGSQFEEVAVVLAGRPSPIQTRELVYTGLTRASARVHWVGSEEELRDSLARPVGRISALGEWL